jgi:Protein kinase domain
MTLSSGTRLGPYEILSPLGAGGMGEVYRARDAKLDRDVALKVLPEAFARDAERMARFEREAKVLASLNHPNIAAIYGLEDSAATRALVMELVGGMTLADRLQSGPIPVDEAMLIARQICEALEYAHERGIVHRDLKPANVKMSNDDTVKVLDFGLAKAVERDITSDDLGAAPTLGRDSTQAGVLLGTPAYMSPEQAKGKAVDRRTDIWAFGCFLYEMLTGRKTFSGETVTDTLAAVVLTEPNWSLLPRQTPPRISALLQRCLQKDPKQRLRDIGEARIAIDEVRSGAPESSSVAHGKVFAAAEPAVAGNSASTHGQAGHGRKWIAAALVLAVVAGGAFWAYRIVQRAEKPRDITFTDYATVKPSQPAVAAPVVVAPTAAKGEAETSVGATSVAHTPATAAASRKLEPKPETSGKMPTAGKSMPAVSQPVAPAPEPGVAAKDAGAVAGHFDGVYAGPLCYGKTRLEPEKCHRELGTILGDKLTGQWAVPNEAGVTMFLSGTVSDAGDVKIEMHSQKEDGTPMASIDLAGTISDGVIAATGKFRRGRAANLTWKKNTRAGR